VECMKGTKILPGAVEMRKPSRGEIAFFRANPHVTGMAAEDGRVVLNPFTALSDAQKRAVAINEAARIVMVRDGMRPTFSLTPEQADQFRTYGALQDVRETIAARLLSGDPSALNPTQEQCAFVEELRRLMGVS
ncbi:MAG: hypothetical protein L0Z53_22670, partial [Acidobacteriales bacterium]|nr:hypothetical protein [Terriglobales bacterium]